jgi:hypothetical protein
MKEEWYKQKAKTTRRGKAKKASPKADESGSKTESAE